MQEGRPFRCCRSRLASFSAAESSKMANSLHSLETIPQSLPKCFSLQFQPELFRAAGVRSKLQANVWTSRSCSNSFGRPLVGQSCSKMKPTGQHQHHAISSKDRPLDSLHHRWPSVTALPPFSKDRQRGRIRFLFGRFGQ